MFCSNCGKKITETGNICNNCGNQNEPLRSFKKLDLDMGNNQENKQRNTEIIKEKIIYRDNPGQKKIIYVLSAVLILLFSILITNIIHIRWISAMTKDDLPVSEEYYHISGSIETAENSYMFVKSEEQFKFKINRQSYEADKIYLAPDISIAEDTIDTRGRMCKISDDVFMLIGE